MQFDDLVRQLGAVLRLPNLVPDDTGACAVMFEDLSVSFHPDDTGGFMSISMLGQGDADDPALQETLLKGNFFSDGVGASALGMTDVGHVALVQHFGLQELSFPAFQQALELFISAANYWRGELGFPAAAVH